MKMDGEAKPTNGNATNEPKPATKTKPKKPARKATKIVKVKPSEKAARTPVPKAALEKLAAAGGKVKIIAARDAKLVGRTAEVVSVATIDKKAYAFGSSPGSRSTARSGT